MNILAMTEKTYTADLIAAPDDCEAAMEFTVIFTPGEDMPWAVSSDAGYDTHQSLDEVLFWNLVMGARHISERLRAEILADPVWAACVEMIEPTPTL